MKAHKTAGELSLKAASDSTRYDPLEIGHHMCDGLIEELYKCAHDHKAKIDEPEYCIVMLRGQDSMIKGVMRRKFYAWPYMPSPRPMQAVFLFRKSNDSLIRLWALPSALAMAVISEKGYGEIGKEWHRTKAWCDAFFDKSFWNYIRKEHGILLQSEHEYLEANREKLIKAGAKHLDTPEPEAFDFSKIKAYKVVDTKKILAE